MWEHSLYDLEKLVCDYKDGITSTIAGVTARPLVADCRASDAVLPELSPGPSAGPAKNRYDNTAMATTTRNTAPVNQRGVYKSEYTFIHTVDYLGYTSWIAAHEAINLTLSFVYL